MSYINLMHSDRLIGELIAPYFEHPLGVIIFLILYGVFFGIKTQLVGESKGYDKGFIWGFFLGFIGYIIVKEKTFETPEDTYLWEKDAGEEEKREQGLLSRGGWRCSKCNLVNASYVTTCVCGEARSKVNKMIYNDK